MRHQMKGDALADRGRWWFGRYAGCVRMDPGTVGKRKEGKGNHLMKVVVNAR